MFLSVTIFSLIYSVCAVPFQTNSETRVYVVDTGIARIPQLPSLLPGFSFNGSTSDDNAHGTFISTVASSYAPDAVFVPVKVADAHGAATLSHVVDGLGWIQQHMQDQHNSGKLSVVLVGIGSASKHTEIDALLQDLAQHAVIVLSAGASHTNTCNAGPTTPNTLIVGAVDQNNHVTAFSNTGPCVALYAPGKDIQGWNHLAERVVLSGTSMAAAAVAGWAAHYIQKHPEVMTPHHVMDFLLDHCTPGVLGLAETDHNRLASFLV